MNTIINRIVTIFFICAALAACATGGGFSKAVVETPSDLAQYPVVSLETTGSFWGFGNNGNYTLGERYTGKFDRSASQSSFLDGFISNNKTSIAASVENKTSGKNYIVACAGGDTSLSLGNFSLGGKKAGTFECTISHNKKQIGTYRLDSDSGLIGPQGKVKGTLTIDDIVYTVDSIHKAPGLLVPVDHVLGYYVKEANKTIAVIQANGGLSLQNQPLSDAKMDALVTTLVASGLRIPEE